MASHRPPWLWLGPLLAALGLASAAFGAAFSDATEEAGVEYLQQRPPPDLPCEERPLGCELPVLTGGVAVADVDGDRWPDLYVTRWDAPDLLFRNLGDGRFEDFTEEAGLAGFDLASNGALFGDIDNDGDPDLMLTVVARGNDGVNDRNYLFVNDGTGRFSEEAVARGVATQDTGPRLTFSMAFGDYDRDGWIDLYVTEWLSAAHSRLLRNRGAEAPGHFEDATDAAGLDLTGIEGFAPAFVDLDGDGWQDLAVAADFGTSRLFWNRGDGTFVDGTAEAGVGTDENGMGSTFGDFDADGDLDWFVTSIFDPDDPCAGDVCSWGPSGNRLYRNEGGRAFSDATDAADVRDGGWGWGTVFLDADNDRDLDLVMTNGVAFDQTDIDDAFAVDPMRFWINDGEGRLSEAAAASGLTDTASGKGLATLDYDGDGDLDLFVVNNQGTPRLYRNELAPGAGWLRLVVEGSVSNRDALGARVSLWVDRDSRPQVREVGVASHFLGQSESALHFGLGSPAPAWVRRVRVEFPASGRVIERRWLRPGRSYRIHEDELACGRLGAEVWVAGLPFLVGLAGRSRRRFGPGIVPQGSAGRRGYTARAANRRERR